ncbi:MULTISPECIES: PadR family transcriptional regulator [unclassified Solwaraspora]|uniref:PadR family transcriptional regulator n=1 Tax=unclassified Solwaraspora TaxID=2627926 RepID=UPI00259B53C6|nr:PadR family transcriptional regulator [Solwaraspora sp. WMMA2056]WJK40793.1 PadR family transcriptional regulator [Solwaraspora sp. WMMA2056]
MKIGEPAFLVMTALADRQLYGYALIEEVRQISGDLVHLKAGSLYAILDRLRAEGLVEVAAEEVVNSRLRRYYRLSGAGAQRLAEESERMQRQARTATTRLQARPRPAAPGVAGSLA